MSKALPARLYKYQPLSAQTLAALKVRTLWFGRPSRLNDPFDCAVPWRLKTVTAEDCLRLIDDASDPRWRQVRNDPRYIDSRGQPTPTLIKEVANAGQRTFAEFAAEFYSNRGVTCFSESPTNTLLWSHYGGGHRGVCLEFDTSSPWLKRLHPVNYSDDLPQLSVVDQLRGDPVGILALFLTKASCWSYEQEWRAIHKEADKEYCYGIEALTAVYLGAALTDPEKDLICHTLHGTPVRLFEVRRSAMSFRLETHTVEYTPYQYRPADAV
jgi:hypothetical protein